MHNNQDQTALASKIQKLFRRKDLKDQIYSEEREWAYFHVHCSEHIPDRGIDVHMFVGHVIPKTTLAKLKDMGFILSWEWKKLGLVILHGITTTFCIYFEKF